MPQNLRDSFLQLARLLMRSGLCDRVPEGLCEAGDNSDIVFGEVV